jgi:hypothetical protein
MGRIVSGVGELTLPVPPWCGVSQWYLDAGRDDPAWLTKLLLTGAGLDRSPVVGFRCAVDLPAGTRNLSHI